MIHFKILTIFPELFPGPLSVSVIGDALKNKLWSFEAINIRDYAKDKHKSVDDTPYGGGAGMVMKADVIASAIESHLETVANPRFLPFSNSTSPHKSRVQIFQKVDLRHGHLFQNSKPSMKIIYLSPRGKVFNQKMAQELAQEKEIMVLCGRYEGVDQRVLDEFAIEEISIGDYVLSGGEIAAYVFIDAILRNISGILGDDESLKEESFSFGNILEYPHYTKPSEWRGCKIPEILLSGHHKKIAEWRKMKAMELTKKIRPDLLEKKPDEPK